MKINLNGITKDYTLQEVAALKKQGYRFILSKKLGVYVPAPVKIHENGETRDTDVGELVRRRAGGEKFLKAKGQPIYAPTDPQKTRQLCVPSGGRTSGKSGASTAFIVGSRVAPTATASPALTPYI